MIATNSGTSIGSASGHRLIDTGALGAREKNAATSNSGTPTIQRRSFMGAPPAYQSKQPWVPAGAGRILSPPGQDLPFSFSRSSLPVLKNGTAFSATWTASPWRGFRPTPDSPPLPATAPQPPTPTP